MHPVGGDEEGARGGGAVGEVCGYVGWGGGGARGVFGVVDVGRGEGVGGLRG